VEEDMEQRHHHIIHKVGPNLYKNLLIALFVFPSQDQHLPMVVAVAIALGPSQDNINLKPSAAHNLDLLVIIGI
jgi:hypothetical protein